MGHRSTSPSSARGAWLLGIALLAASLPLVSCASLKYSMELQRRQAESDRMKEAALDIWVAMDRSHGAGIDEWLPKALAYAKDDRPGLSSNYSPAEWLAHASEICIQYKRLDLLQAVRDRGAEYISGKPLSSLVGDYAPGKKLEMEDFLQIKQGYRCDTMFTYKTKDPVLWLSDAAALALYDRFQTVVLAALQDWGAWFPGAEGSTQHGADTHEYHIPVAEQLELDARWVETYSPVLAAKMRSIRLAVLQAISLKLSYPQASLSLKEFIGKYPEVADYPKGDEAKRQAALCLERAGRAGDAAKLYASLGMNQRGEELIAQAKADLALYLSRMPDFFTQAQNSAKPIECLPEITSWASPLYAMKNRIPRESFDAKLALQLAEAYRMVATSMASALNSEFRRLKASLKDEEFRDLYRGYGDLSNYATAASLAFGAIPGHEADGDLFNRLAIKAFNDRATLKELRPGAAR